MSTYPPNFNDPDIINLCLDSGQPVSVDGFYAAINEATGNTNGSIDDVWKLYVTDVLGFEYVGQSPAHYGLTFDDGGLGTPWALDSAISDPETFPTKTEAPTIAGSSFSRSTVALTADHGTYGDFPTDTVVFESEAFSNTNVGWGQQAGGADCIGGLWIEITTPITQLVASATLRIRTTATVSGSPTFRIHAVNGISPVLPSNGDTSALGAYTTPGWTSSYATQALVASTTYPIDVTDIINELVLNNGTTGTSVLFAFYADAAPGATASFNIAAPAGYAAGLDIVRSLNHRDYQTCAINGAVLWYWPFDAGTSGTRGVQSTHRAVVSPTTEATSYGEAVEVSDSYSNVPLEFYARPQQFGAVPRAFPSELERGGHVRQFFGPLTENSDPDKLNWMYTCVYRAAGVEAHDFLMFAQFTRLTSSQAFPQFLFDVLGNFSASFQFVGEGSTNTFHAHASWSAGDDWYPGKSVNIVDAGAFTAGSTVSLALWYDNSANAFTFGYNSGAGWQWQTPWADAGVVITEMSGVQFGEIPNSVDDSVVQGWLMLELMDDQTMASVERACTEMRVLWGAGIKSLPPVLFV
jgi:hypothetical protein